MDTLTLSRHDLLFTNSLHRHTVRVLPSSKKKHQKIVAADDSGSVTCIQVKAHQPSTVFRLPPGKRDITALDVAADKVYVAFGHAIHGLLKKKGNTFLQYSTPLSEDIQHMAVTAGAVYTGCEYSVNSFTMPSKQSPTMREGMFYQTDDRIGGIVALEARGDGRVENERLVVGTHDRMVRVLRDSESVMEQRVHAAVSTLSRGYSSSGSAASTHSLWYGSDGGGAGELRVSDDDMHTGAVISNAHHKQTVTAITTADLTHSGQYDVVVGHDDGTFLLYPYSQPIDASSPAYQYEMHESITSLDAGCVQHPDSVDLVVATYSGKILSFGHDVDSKGVAGKLASGEKEEKHKVMVNLQTDIDALASKVAMYKEKYNKLTFNTDTPSAPPPPPADEQSSALPIRCSFRLDAADKCWLLSVEIPTSIDMCIMQSNVSGMDVLDRNETGKCVQSVSEEGQHDYTNVIRVTDNSNRLQLTIRSSEGDSGMMTVYVVPKQGSTAQGARPCNKVQLALKPLHLHQKAAMEAEQWEAMAGQLSTLTLTGSFSLAEIHTWLSLCLPGLPPHVPPLQRDECLDLYYDNVYTRSPLRVQYKKGHCTLTSDNLSALSTVKDVVSREAVQKKSQLNIQLSYQPLSIPHFLGRLRSELDHFLSLAYKMSILDALDEIKQHEEQYAAFLQPVYVDILRQAADIRAAWHSAPASIKFLTKLLENLFVDKGKLQGRDVSRQVGRVQAVMAKYSFDALLAVFKD